MAFALALGGLVFYAVNAEGERVHRADLNDAGVWITSRDLGLLARQNTAVDLVDARVPARAGTDFDVLQDAAAVVSVEGVSGTIIPVDPRLGQAVVDDAVVVAGQPVMGGGSVAVVDAAKGSLWATRVDRSLGISSLASLDAESKALDNVGPQAVVAASSSGRLYAASAAKATVSTLTPKGSGYGEPGREDLAASPVDGLMQAAVVGETPVFLDGAGNLITTDLVVELPADNPRLQTSGPQDEEVFVAHDRGLVAVDLSSGKVREVVEAAGEAAAPVRLGGCLYAAWAAGSAGAVYLDCGNEEFGPNSFELSPAAELVFRVNRSNVLLNDTKSGDVWRVEGALPTEVSDWVALKPKKLKKDDQEQKQDLQTKQAPQAKPDLLGAKPGRTTVLHVLDNDMVSGGGALSIIGVSGAEGDAGARVQLAPDRQSLLLTLSADYSKKLRFGYRISDGSGGDDSEADGDVTVTVREAAGNAKPVLRENLPEVPTVYPVAAGATIEVPVLVDWRDPEYGDPVSLDEVSGKDGFEVSATTEGLLRIRTPREGGTKKVAYAVSTGGEPATGSVILNVLPPKSHKPIPAQTAPDVAAGEVGGVITVEPLNNDIPGADPTDAQAHLVLGGRVQPAGGLKVATDLESGVVSVRARRPGIYALQYLAGFGAAKRSAGTIQVVVDPATKGSNEPIATPDTTTVRGMSPMLVDVLANDYDAQGRMLAVQSARPVSEDGGLEVAVIEGRWLRISATTTELTPVTQPISYELSNGDATATGTVTVTQKAPLPSELNAPVPGEDQVIVRVGDTALVPVLDNDATPSGDPIGLQIPTTTEVVGELTVNPPLGRAYVVGRTVRYVAPDAAEIDGPTTVEVQYVVENVADPTRPSATGTMRVQVNPEPSDTNPNQPPTPRLIEGRVVEGDMVSLKLPLVGNDPDGDSVSIVGLAGAPLHGRILGFGANALTYQAFPGSPGTDEFGYVVTDRFGSRSEGEVRVAVGAPGAPQAPVAIDDVYTADYDRTLEIDVLANDLRSPGTRLRVLPLEEGAAGEAELLSPSGPIRVTSSDDKQEPVVVVYTISNGLSESKGEIVVRSREGYNNPPVVLDAFAQPDPDSTSVDVDVLEKAFDVDSEGAELTVESVGSTEASASGGTVTLPVLDVPQVVPFRVVDAEGAATAAVIYVPAKPVDVPYLRPDALIELQPGETKDVPVSELVADPENDPVVLTISDLIQAAPADNLRAGAPDSNQTLRVTAGERSGPGAVTFQVSDRAELSDSTASLATLTVPVQVGDPEPIITCPTDAITLVEGAPARVLDIASLCHVWTATNGGAEGLSFEADWVEGQRPEGVTVETTDQGISLAATVDATRGARGSLAVAADGFKATGVLGVRVVAAGPPRLRPITAEGKAGKKVTIDVSNYASSPFGEAATWAITDVVKLDGPAAEEQVSGTTVTLTPSEFGTYRFRVTVVDDGDTDASERPTASATLTLSVVDKPETPTGLRWDGTKRDKEVRLAWNAPQANGGAIEYYTVEYGGGSTKCPSTSCSIPLTDNGEYSFTVSATNAFGTSEPSSPVKGTADRVPEAVVGLTVVNQRDHQVSLRWSPPPGAGGDYSAVERYFVSWPGGGVKTIGAQPTFVATGLTNGENITFSVWAENDAGPSPDKATVSGMGAGKPEAPTGVLAEPVDLAGRTQSGVTVRWNPVAANGPEPVTYRVTRTPGAVICDWQQSTSCTDTLPNDGSRYNYSVQARNGEATAPRETNPDLHVSSISTSAEVVAAARPDDVTVTDAYATGNNSELRISFTVGNANGARNEIECNPRCGTAPATVAVSGGSVTATIGGFTNGASSTVQIRTCNGSGEADQCSAWVAAPAVVTWGPIGTVTLNASNGGQWSPIVNWSFSVNPNGNPVHYVLRRNGSVIRQGDTGRGGFSTSGSENIGNSQSANFTLDVTEGGREPGQTADRAGVSRTASATTDPPRPVLSISKGATCTPATCPATGPGAIECSNYNFCWKVLTTTENFPGSVSCHMEATGGGFGSPWSQSGNSTVNGAGNWVGRGITFRAVCDGVASSWVSW